MVERDPIAAYSLPGCVGATSGIRGNARASLALDQIARGRTPRSYLMAFTVPVDADHDFKPDGSEIEVWRFSIHGDDGVAGWHRIHRTTRPPGFNWQFLPEVNAFWSDTALSYMQTDAATNDAVGAWVIGSRSDGNPGSWTAPLRLSAPGDIPMTVPGSRR